MKTWMVYGPLSLEFGEEYESADWSFDYAVETESGFDFLVAATSTDGLHFDGFAYTGESSGSSRIDLTTLRYEPEVWIGFQFSSDHASGFALGAAVDNVTVRRSRPIVLPEPTGDSYGWTISASDVDPYVNIGSIAGGVRRYLLWYVCDDVVMGAASGLIGRLQFDGPPGTLFAPEGGVTNTGTLPTLVLSLPECSEAPLLVGTVFTINATTDRLCLTDSEFGHLATLDCVGEPGSTKARGFNAEAGTSCVADSLCGEPLISVEELGWGAIKSLYRK